MRKRRRLSRWPPAAVSVPTESKAKAREKKRAKGWRTRRARRGGPGRERGDSPGSNKPAEVEVTLKLLHG